MPPSPGPAVPEQDLDDARPLAPEGEQRARECVLLQRVLNQHRKPIHALPHVGLAQRKVHLHAGRNYHHRVVSRSATCRRTTSGSLPSGANTRRPSARSIAVMPLGSSLVKLRRWVRPSRAESAAVASVKSRSTTDSLAALRRMVIISLAVPFATLAPEQRADGTGLFNLSRNVGSSVGISVVS